MNKSITHKIKICNSNKNNELEISFEVFYDISGAKKVKNIIVKSKGREITFYNVKQILDAIYSYLNQLK